MKSLPKLLSRQQNILAVRTFYSLPCSLCLSAIASSAAAQIIPDTTLPNNSVVTPNGNVLQIDGGTTAGTNLFHSFAEFSLPQGNIAEFNNALEIQNILTRVTGSNISQIDGLINANGTANLFLINPNGIVLGENAALDIGGSFVGSTAESIVFTDGGEFSTVSPTTPLLTVNAPSGLNMGADAGQIVVKGSGNNIYYDWENFVPATEDRPMGFAAPSQETLALVGNGISLEGGNITAEQGRIELGSVNQEGRVNVTKTDAGLALDYRGIDRFADLSFTEAASADASGNGGGVVQLTGKNISLADGSVVLADTLKDGAGGLINVRATDTVELVGENPDTYFWTSLLADTARGSTGESGDIVVNAKNLNAIDGGQITSVVYGEGNGGDIDVKAENVNISGSTPDGPSGLFAIAEFTATGNGGNITIKAQIINMSDGGEISSTTWGGGNAGKIDIDTKEISISEFAGIFANADEFSIGQGGNIDITAGDLYLADGGQIASTTFSEGNAGQVNIEVNNIEVIGASDPTQDFATGIFSTAEIDSVGNAGTVKIKTDNLSISNGAQIQSATSGSGNGGQIIVDAKNTDLEGFNAGGQTALISSATESTGDGGNIEVATNNLTIKDGATISASNFSTRNPDLAPGTGKAGNINLQANSIQLDSSVTDETSITASTFAAGGGNIILNTNSFTALNNSEVTAETQGEGAGGSIQVTTDNFNLSKGAFFSTSTSGAGNAGQIEVNSDRIDLTGTGTELLSKATANTGNGGAIALTASEINLSDRATINTSTAGSGDGGKILLDSNSLDISGQAEITVSSTGSGQAGNIELAIESIASDRGLITATSEQTGGGDIKINSESIDLQNDSLISTSVLDSNGGGGNITIDNSNLILARNNSDIRANAVLGSGGNIDITTELIFTDLTSDIDASSKFGLDGTVEIKSPDSEKELNVAILPETIQDPTSLIAASCPISDENTFAVTGNGGIPPTPYQTQPLNAAWYDLRPVNLEKTQVASRSAPLKEASTTMINSNGELELVAITLLSTHRWVKSSCQI